MTDTKEHSFVEVYVDPMSNCKVEDTPTPPPPPKNLVSEKSQTYFIARAQCHKHIKFNGTVDPKEGEVVWICIDRDGWSYCHPNKSHAYHFKTVERAWSEAKCADGTPHNYRLKHGTFEVFEVTMERKLVTQYVSVPREQKVEFKTP